MYTIKPNNFIQKYLPVSFLLILTINILSCNIRTTVIDDAETQDTNFNDTAIELTQLNEDTPGSIWKLFFNQRGAETFGERLIPLQPETKNLELNFKDLGKPTIRINSEEQGNDIVAGVIKYLIYHKDKISLEDLRINAVMRRSDTDDIRISSLPSEIGELTSLKRLCLNYHNIKVIPAEIGKLTELIELDLLSNKIEEIPAEIGNLVNIEELNLSQNQIWVLPSQLSQLIKSQLSKLNKLRKIYLDTAIGLTQLNEDTPDSIWKLFFNQRGAETFGERLIPLQPETKNLELKFEDLGKPTIRINSEEQGNDIVAGVIKYLTYHKDKISLEDLQIEASMTRSDDDVRISSLPSEIGELTSLKRLCLNYHNIKVIPAEIGKLTELIELDLLSNKIEEIPAEIGNLVNIEELNLSQNQIWVLPSQLSQLIKLRRISLVKNQLTEIPPIQGLPKLKYARFERNQIQSVSSSVKDVFKKFRSIGLSRNPWLKVEELNKIDSASFDFEKYASKQAALKSLTTLLMWYIQNNLSNYTEEELTRKGFLEKESDLSIENQIAVLKSQHTFFKNIVYFEKIEGIDIPVYLDYQITNFTDICNMLEQIKDKELYIVK
jgi:Leucine-rich repeat (LRR) protein